jgi:DNA-binding winged helix-turn-helix (wHTH) protein/TolB-like protein
MSHQPERIYEFGPFRLDAAERLLLRDHEVIPLQPKVLDLLLVLVERRGHLLEKDELMSAVWPDTLVEEANLANNISILRKSLGENGQQFIETVPKRGYRFVAPVQEKAVEPAGIEDPPSQTMAVGVEQQAEPLSWPSAWDLGRWIRSRPGLIATLIILPLIGIAGLTISWYLRRQPASPIVAIKSIAVLPFKPLNRSPDDEYLGLGLADAVITGLSGTGKIIVRPTSAVGRYTAPDQDPIAAGREQRVDAVLESSIWRSGDKVRVTARLLNVRDGVPLWSYQCEEFCTDIFSVQTLISERMAEALMSQLTGEKRARLTKHYTENREANRLYLQGRFYWNKRTEEGLKKGIEYFQEAIDKDLNYALAYAGLADCYAILANFYGDPHELFPRAKAYAARALEIDETLAEAHTTLAGIKFHDDWDWSGAETGYKRAIELNPGYATAHQRYSLFLICMGRTEESLARIKRALELDPVSLSINSSLGWRLYFARQYDQAIEHLQKTLEMDPNYPGTNERLGEV